MADDKKADLIKNHERIKLTEIDVLRRLSLSYNDCIDEDVIRKFCAANRRTLPDMLEIEVLHYSSENKAHNEQYQWHINIYENPNEKEPA